MQLPEHVTKEEWLPEMLKPRSGESENSFIWESERSIYPVAPFITSYLGVTDPNAISGRYQSPQKQYVSTAWTGKAIGFSVLNSGWSEEVTGAQISL